MYLSSSSVSLVLLTCAKTAGHRGGLPIAQWLNSKCDFRVQRFEKNGRRLFAAVQNDFVIFKQQFLDGLLLPTTLLKLFSLKIVQKFPFMKTLFITLCPFFCRLFYDYFMLRHVEGSESSVLAAFTVWFSMRRFYRS